MTTVTTDAVATAPRISNSGATGATLNLTYTGTDKVDKLFIGGVQQAAGVYGPSATNIPQITGTGTLTVLSGPASAGYSSWATLNGAGANLYDDHDKDGVANGVEYFMNSAPGFTANPTLGAGNSITWTNGGNIPSTDYPARYVVQTSSDPVTWADVLSGDLTTNTSGPGGSLTYTLTGSGSRFVRLKVKP